MVPVSILMPLFNRDKYVAEAISSVLSSSFSNFELIIVDDCSTDKSYEIAKSFAEKDQRIKLYRNEKNLGQFQNRNKCAEYAIGEYIKYLDSDDIIYLYGLETMIWAITQYPNAGAAVSYELPNDLKPYPILTNPKETYLDHFFGKSAISIGPSGIIFRKSAFWDVGGFSKTPFVGSDTEFMLKISAKYPIVKMPTSLIWWRRHNEQDFAAGNLNNEYLFKNYHMSMVALNDKDCPLDKQIKEKAIRKVKQNYARLILRNIFILHRFTLAYQMFKQSGLTANELLGGFKHYV